MYLRIKKKFAENEKLSSFILKNRIKLIGLCILLLILGVVLFLKHKVVKAPAQNENNTVVIEDPFMRGEYYFNADGDGAYDLQKAREAYEAVLHASSTSHALVWYQLGRIDFIEGSFENALYKFEKQIAYFGDEIPNVYYMIGLTNGFKARKTNDPQDWQKASEGFQKYIEFFPDSPWARTDLAWVYFSQGKFEEMLPILEEGLKYNNDHPWLHNMYGLASMNTGDTEKAKIHFEKALIEAQKLSPEDWGRAYPGNDPAYWATGLESFIDAIEKNLALVTEG